MKKNIVWRILAALVICAMLASGIVMLPVNAVKAEEPEAPMEQAAAEIEEEYVPMYADGTAVLYTAPDKESEVICELEDGTFLFVKEYNEEWRETQAGFFVLAASLRWEKVKKVAEAPVDEEPVDEEPIDEEPVDEEPIDEEPVDEEPVDEEPVDEEPADEEPVDEEPIDEEPVDEEPVEEEPIDEEPVDEEPVDEEPVDEEPIDEEPVDEEPINEEPVDEEPIDEEPIDEEPVDEEPVDEEPVDEEPIDEEPVEEEPIDEEPIDEEPIDEEPIDEEPIDEEPVDEEPVDEEPIDEEPIDEEPIDEESIDEEPVVEEPVVEEPVAEEPVAEEPAVEEPAVEEPAADVLEIEDIEIEELLIEEPAANKNPVVVIEEYETPLGLPGQAESAEVPEFNSSNLLTEEDLPENAVLLAEILDDLNEKRSINIYIGYEGEALRFGDEVTLYAVLRGYEDCVFTVQWQVSDDDEDYEDIEGENNLTYSTIVTEENYTKYWRIVATITAVNVPDELLSGQD